MFQFHCSIYRWVTSRIISLLVFTTAFRDIRDSPVTIPSDLWEDKRRGKTPPRRNYLSTPHSVTFSKSSNNSHTFWITDNYLRINHYPSKSYSLVEIHSKSGHINNLISELQTIRRLSLEKVLIQHKIKKWLRMSVNNGSKIVRSSIPSNLDRLVQKLENDDFVLFQSLFLSSSSSLS
jgi:hypothetical protein